MNIHKNARLTPLRREEMALAVIEGGLSKAHAALMHGVALWRNGEQRPAVERLVGC